MARDSGTDGARAPIADAPIRDHAEIWLQPVCDDCREDRLWCQDDVWGKCGECDRPSSRYVLAPQAGSTGAVAPDLSALTAERDRLREALGEVLPIAESYFYIMPDRRGTGLAKIERARAALGEQP